MDEDGHTFRQRCLKKKLFLALASVAVVAMVALSYTTVSRRHPESAMTVSESFRQPSLGGPHPYPVVVGAAASADGRPKTSDSIISARNSYRTVQVSARKQPETARARQGVASLVIHKVSSLTLDSAASSRQTLQRETARQMLARFISELNAKRSFIELVQKSSMPTSSDEIMPGSSSPRANKINPSTESVFANGREGNTNGALKPEPLAVNILENAIKSLPLRSQLPGKSRTVTCKHGESSSTMTDIIFTSSVMAPSTTAQTSPLPPNPWNDSNSNTSSSVEATQETLSAGERLQAAVKAVKMSPISSAFKYSDDVFFQPPALPHFPKFPPVMLSPTFCTRSSTRRREGSAQETEDEPSSQGRQPLSPFLVVLVLSSYLPNGTAERMAVRETYGSVARGEGRWPGGKPLEALVGLVFLLGTPPSESLRQEVLTESQHLGDLLVSDFVDSYRNLTLKVLSGLHWALRSCPSASYLLKADDDTFLNMPLLTAFLRQRGQGNAVYGHPYFSPPVQREGRWSVPQRAYPPDAYPVYMSGTAYALSRDAAEKVVRLSASVPPIPVEDAYVTGILTQMARLQRVAVAGFTHFREGRAGTCEFVLDTRMVGNGMTAADKRRLWATLRIDDRRLCV